MADFKPMKHEKVVISVRIDNEKLLKIDEIANDNDISRNELITQCIDYALEHVVSGK